MGNGEVAREFHEATKHTLESVRRGGRLMDWDNKPHPFKVYETELPDGEAPADLLHLLRWGAGVLRKREYDGEMLYFRTYASAGALYPVELYVLSDSGVHHFDPLHCSLRKLRDAVGQGGVSLVLTGIPWRTCWKYGDRGYRHLWWDAGTILANILALAAEGGFRARVNLGFDDDAMAHVVDVDGVREFPLCVVSFGDGREFGDVELLGLPVRPLSAREERFPEITRVHAAGKLAAEEVPAWQGTAEDEAPAAEAWEDVERVIRRRGSARRFGGAPIPASDLEAILGRMSAGMPADYAPRLVRPYLAVHNVTGLESGVYVWKDGELRRLRAGDVRVDAAYLCLGQRLGGSGAATIFLMADLEEALARFGDRGYRAAELEGGISLGRIDLAAHSLGWSATGLTFFDDDVRNFFSPHASGRECMVVCAIGQRQGRLLPLA